MGEIHLLNHSLAFDVGVYSTKLSSAQTQTNAKEQNAIFMPYPTGSDLGIELNFVIPPNYASAPVLTIRGLLDGTPANVLAFSALQIGRADSEASDTAYEAEDTASNSTWTGYADEDVYVETITLTPASAYVAGDIVFLRFTRDDSVDTTTFDFLLLDLAFTYTAS